MSIDRLTEVGSVELIESHDLHDRLLLAGRVADELGVLLRRKNGFYAFESALHVFPAGQKRGVMDLETWNSVDLWRIEYGDLATGYLLFAEDIFGNQFALQQEGIYSFDSETGDVELIAKSLNEWAELILDDYEFRTGYPLAHEWQSQYGTLKAGQRLAPKVPFVCGGAFEVGNLYSADAVEAMRFRGHLAQQIRDLPDGAHIEFKMVP